MKHESISEAITEIIKWNPITWRREITLADLDHHQDKVYDEAFRNRLKAAPVLEASPFTYSYIKNIWEQGIKFVNKFEQIVKHIKPSDIPDQKEFDKMGLGGWWDRQILWPAVDPNTPTNRQNYVLDHLQLNDRDFRQRCIQANGKNYVLYQGAYADTGKANHLQADTWINWMANPCQCQKPCEHLNSIIDPADADSIVQAYANLNIDRNRTIKSVFGYATKDERRNGLKSFDEEELADYALDIEQLEAQLPKLSGKNEQPPKRTLEDERAFYLDLSYKLIENGRIFLSDINIDLNNPLEQAVYIETMAQKALIEEPEPNPKDIDTIIEYGFAETDEDDIESEDQKYENIEFKANTDGWTAFPLSDGNDTIDYTWITYIKTASVKQLQSWKKAAYKVKITPTQKSRLWERIWERQEILCKQIELKVKKNKQALEIIDEMIGMRKRSINKYKQAGGLIYSYSNGGTFSACTVFDFKNIKGDSDIVFYLWNQRKKIFK